ncbi:MAG: cephalosporin hydroxylase [Actinobacteria bacterium]|nr:MAG: cephalosporin hydroxylase [Actinomycetota bacterium]
MATFRERFPRNRRDVVLAIDAQFRRLRKAIYRGPVREAGHRLFFTELVEATDNFGQITWLGRPIWQNVLDLWTIQETLYELRPALLIETGTNRGGSSFFFAQLFDLMDHGRVITSDVERLHDLHHPRVEYLIGSSTSPEVIGHVRSAVAQADGPVLVILDSDHNARHVTNELELYAPLVTPGSYIIVQDGSIDTLRLFRVGRPGPLPAIRDFLARHPEFDSDRTKEKRFVISHSPEGWLRRRPDTSTDKGVSGSLDSVRDSTAR